MKATFSINKYQWTDLSDGIINKIREICGFGDVDCGPQVDDQWHVTFTSREDESCTCDAVEMLHYITDLTVAGEIVQVTWVSSVEEEETEETE
jgi:hypothetical protein